MKKTLICAVTSQSVDHGALFYMTAVLKGYSENMCDEVEIRLTSRSKDSTNPFNSQTRFKVTIEEL